MKLNALDLHLPVAEAHDKSVGRGGGDFEAGGQALALHDQRMVTSGLERIGQAFEDGPAVVMDLAGLAMHQFRRPDDLAAESLPDGLVAEAHSQDGYTSGQLFNHLKADPCFVGSFRPGRDDNRIGQFLLDFIHSGLIVSDHSHLGAQFSQILDQVVSKGIVVVDYEDHTISLSPGSFKAIIEEKKRYVNLGW